MNGNWARNDVGSNDEGGGKGFSDISRSVPNKRQRIKKFGESVTKAVTAQGSTSDLRSVSQGHVCEKWSQKAAFGMLSLMYGTMMEKGRTV